jgi:peroxin-1
MPSHSDRLEVRSPLCHFSLATNPSPRQIMEACARKIALSPSVDLSSYAAKTQGFSGADLQALIYNAHLDAIHETLSATTSTNEEGAALGKREEQDIAYTAFGGTEKQEDKVLSRAEQASVNKRVSKGSGGGTLRGPFELMRPFLLQLELILSAMGTTGQGKTSNTQSSNMPTSRPTVRLPLISQNPSLADPFSSSDLRQSAASRKVPLFHSTFSPGGGAYSSSQDASYASSSPPTERKLTSLFDSYSDFVDGRSANGLPSGEASDEVGGRASLM